MATKTKNLIRALWIIPLLIGLLLGVLQIIDAEHTGILLKGIFVTLIGGAILGYVAKRFLDGSDNATQTILALGAVSILGLVSLGIVYFGILPDPINTVNDYQRATVQILVFLEYLSAIGVGIALVNKK